MVDRKKDLLDIEDSGWKVRQLVKIWDMLYIHQLRLNPSSTFCEPLR